MEIVSCEGRFEGLESGRGRGACCGSMLTFSGVVPELALNHEVHLLVTFDV